MVLANYAGKTVSRAVTACLTLSFLLPIAVGAQNSLPLPGNSSQYVAPGVASGPHYSAPVPGSPAPGAAGINPAGASAYERLPLNPGNAIARLEELRNFMPQMRPKEFQDSIGEYCDWLSDMADAHWKLSQSFAKNDATKTQAESEKALCHRFGALKRQAMLLKAEFLISQKRFPEALNPLVDIVVAEPRTETGQQAYKLLKEIGFSEENVREAAR